MHRVRVRVVEDALDANNTIARANRDDFDRHGVTVLNIMSAPGAGKTTLLERILRDGIGDLRVGVLEGDVQGSLDADRLAHLHIPVTQLNTDSGFGGECHLDANMVRSALGSIPLDEIDLLIVENVGNLVCPAEFHIGEDARIMVASVAEGDDKPGKYPLMFRTCELVVVNKIDLLEHVDFSMDRFDAFLDAVHPDVGRMRVSARTGEGVDAFRDWLARLPDRAGGGAGLMLVAGAIDERVACGETYFGAESERLARLCHAMAERFARGGRLIAFGASAADVSDVRHVAVEFVHPVIVGKRALPALGMSCADVALLARDGDIAMAFGAGPEVERAVRAAAGAGCLTVAFAPVGAEWEFVVPTSDPFIAQEQVETTYHVLWELVHVFFEHRGLLAGRDDRPVHDTGASSFLYPFLSEAENDLDAVLADVAASAVAKGAEAGELRTQTLDEGRAALEAAALALRGCFAGGGKLLALGNGGSATDAMDAVADLRHPPAGMAPLPAIDLTEDAPILTAVANDVGVEAIFSRQVIAYGHPGDALLSFSTSGNSTNVIAALDEGRRRGLATIALVGYDGGRIAAEGLADHVVVTRSEHIPRIQEAQASAWHVLRGLVAA